MKQEKLIRIAYKPDKIIEIISDFSRKETYRRLTLAGLGVEQKWQRIEFTRY